MDTTTVYLNKNDATVYGVREPMPIQIVCGDCSGRADATGDIELLPLRTFLSVDGRCYTCGGRSYVIASELCCQLRRTLTERRLEGAASQTSERGGWSERLEQLWNGKQSGDAQYSESDRLVNAVPQPT
jgi:hypothetical protein